MNRDDGTPRSWGTCSSYVRYSFLLGSAHSSASLTFRANCCLIFLVIFSFCAFVEQDFRDRVDGDDRKAGVGILMRSLSAPMMQIAANAGEIGAA